MSSKTDQRPKHVPHTKNTVDGLQTGLAHLTKVMFFVGIVLVMPVALAGQWPTSIQSGVSSDMDHQRGLSREFRRNLLMRANEDRQKGMVTDAERLVELASELEVEMRTTGEGPLSDTELKKVEQIQKLARSVKEKMEYPVTPY